MLELNIRLLGEKPEVLVEYLREFIAHLERVGDIFQGCYGYKTIENGMINYECTMEKLK